MKILHRIFKTNQRGMLSLHAVLPILLAVIAIGGVGAYVMSSSRASGGFVCTIGPEFKGADGQQWFSAVVQNRTGVMTNSLADLAFQGKTPANTTFTWNWQTYNNTYVDWTKGFSGVKILNNGTVLGQVRKPTNPTGVGQANWTLIANNVKYTCNTSTNITTTYNALVKSAATAPATPVTTPTPAPVTPAPTVPTPTPTPTTPGPAPVISCSTVIPVFTLGKALPVSVTVTNKGVPSTTATQYVVDLSNKYSNGTLTSLSTVAIPVLASGKSVVVPASFAAYSTKAGATVTVYVSVKTPDGKTSIPCDKGYATFDLGTGKVTATPATDAPKAITPPVSTTKPVDTGGGSGAPTQRQAPVTPKIADLGYTANLHCVTTTKDKTKVTGAPCATANAVMLTVYGTNKTPEKSKLSYDIDVTATADKFGRVNGCAPRTIVLNGVDHSYGCTVLYTDQSFFVSVKNSVTNAFNSILRKAKTDTFLNKSEAKAAVAKLQKVDALTKNTTIVFSYKGYESQTIKGTNLTFDYNETSVIQRIKNIQEADCKAAGGSFVSFADGCDLPKPGPAVPPAGDPAPSAPVKPTVSTTKPTCKAGTHLKSVGTNEWACVNNSTTTTVLTCPADHPNLILVSSARGSVSPEQQLDNKTCEESKNAIWGFISGLDHTKPIPS